MDKQTILIIDDEEKFRQLLSRIISLEGYTVLQAQNIAQGLKIIQQEKEIDLILTDVKLPDGNGIDLLEKIKSINPLCEIIVMTAFGTIHDGVKAMKMGAFDYFTKGDDNDQIIPAINRASDKVKLQKRVSELEKRVGEKFSFKSITGKSKSILAAIELAQSVAPNDTTVLLTGETGTGKEVFAQAIHQASKRTGKAFVALNCSAFSKDIIESELFGHKQGAFTGAVKDKKGLLEEANGGTLFLDEIGEMPLELQAKLLRVLETNEFIKLGDTKTIKVSLRLIAATNKDLKKESDENRFRSDLYYRLNVFQITLPSLRERVKDIGILIEFFVNQFSIKTNKKPLNISKEYIETLEKYTWPGNIRELKNIIERSVILTNEDTLTPSILPYDLQHQPEKPNGSISAFSMATAEKLHIQKVLNYTKGNKAETARLLEIGIATLYRKLEEYDIH